MRPQQFCLHTVFAGTQKDTRDVAGEGTVFAGSKKCTRNSADCLRCSRVLKKVPISVERVLCLRVQKNVPAMVLNVVILYLQSVIANC